MFLLIHTVGTGSTEWCQDTGCGHAVPHPGNSLQAPLCWVPEFSCSGGVCITMLDWPGMGVFLLLTVCHSLQGASIWAMSCQMLLSQY